jgi:threonine aldolase
VDNHRARLGDDHRNARALAEALAGVPGLHVDVDAVVTNIVMIDLEKPCAKDVMGEARKRGVRLGAVNATRIRMVTHLDVDAGAIPVAADAVRAAVAVACG